MQSVTIHVGQLNLRRAKGVVVPPATFYFYHINSRIIQCTRLNSWSGSRRYRIIQNQFRLSLNNGTETSPLSWISSGRPNGLRVDIFTVRLGSFISSISFSSPLSHVGSRSRKRPSSSSAAAAASDPVLVSRQQVVMTFVSMMITDRFGRRSLLMYSMTSMGVCFMGLSYYFFAKRYNPRVADSLDWLPLVAIVLYVSMFSVGCGPIPYIIIGEIFSSEVSARSPRSFSKYLVPLLTLSLPISCTRIYFRKHPIQNEKSVRSALNTPPRSFSFHCIFRSVNKRLSRTDPNGRQLLTYSIPVSFTKPFQMFGTVCKTETLS